MLFQQDNAHTDGACGTQYALQKFRQHPRLAQSLHKSSDCAGHWTWDDTWPIQLTDLQLLLHCVNRCMSEKMHYSFVFAIFMYLYKKYSTMMAEYCWYTFYLEISIYIYWSIHVIIYSSISTFSVNLDKFKYIFWVLKFYLSM